MKIQALFFKSFSLLQAYCLIILVLALMLLQLNITSALLQFDFFSIAQQTFFLTLSEQTNGLEIAFILGFLLCCVVWYSYRPMMSFYIFCKTHCGSLEGLVRFITTRASRTLSDQQIQQSWIQRSVGKISKKLVIRCPKVVIDPSLDINAKAVPGLFHTPLIILTQGLLNKLTVDEIEAVLAHELAHIAMSDTYSMSVTDLILFLAVWLPVYTSHLIIDCVFLYKWRGKNIGFIVSLIFVLLAYGFLALFFLNTLNRYYELRADRTAMNFVNLQSFLNALNRIHEAQSNAPWVLEWCMAYTPKAVQRFVLKIFLSHPSIPTRIQALQ